MLFIKRFKFALFRTEFLLQRLKLSNSCFKPGNLCIRGGQQPLLFIYRFTEADDISLEYTDLLFLAIQLRGQLVDS